MPACVRLMSKTLPSRICIHKDACRGAHIAMTTQPPPRNLPRRPAAGPTCIPYPLDPNPAPPAAMARACLAGGAMPRSFMRSGYRAFSCSSQVGEGEEGQVVMVVGGVNRRVRRQRYSAFSRSQVGIGMRRRW
jgi:hypothetical protein